jgi:Spy/CpxP family protein refolding chaperone
MRVSKIGIGGVLAAMLVAAACDKGEGSGGAAAPSASASAAPAPATSASAAPSGSAAPAASGSAAPAADAGPSPDAQAAEDEVVNDELATHHRHHHQGFAGFIISALETVGIGPDQQGAVDGFRKEYRGKTKPLHEANKALRQVVADGVAAGSLDKAKVDPAVAKAATAAQAAQVATVEFLEHIHGVLRPEQRAAFVDKVDAHWAAWRDANDKKEEGGKPDRHLRHLAKELSLSKDQVDKVRAALDAVKPPAKPFDPAAADAYIKAFDTAFVAEKFEAKKLPAAGPDSAKIVTWGADRMTSFYGALAPALTPEQRATVADKLRKRGEMPDTKEKP